MPSYKVKESGTHDGVLYDPNGKRKVLTVDTAFKKCPSWLEPIKGETAQQKGARTKAENKAKADAEKQAKDDKAEIDKVTFTDNATSATQTL